MNDKIENNPSHKKFKNQIEGAKHLVRFASFFGLGSNKFKEAIKGLPGIDEQFTRLTSLPDKFNQHFGERGWICYGGMNPDLLEECIKKAVNGKIEEAENDLVNYYSSYDLRYLTSILNSTPEFQIRKRFIDFAYEDSLNERYYAAIPILLMVMDGVVSDIDKQSGFFAEKTNMTAWDSIAAHYTGLTALKEIFNSPRKKTSNEETFMPYRNGILHGRDLGYDNKITTAKCWLAIFAINEWARDVKAGKRKEVEPEKELTVIEQWKELKETFENYDTTMSRVNELRKLCDQWKARNLTPGVDIPKSGAVEAYREFTPERRAVEFVECWSKQNYGAIANQIKRYTEASINTEAGKIRKIFEDKKLISYEIIKVKDFAPALTEVTLSVEFIYDNKTYKKEINLRMQYQGQNAETMVIGENGGEWKYFQAFFHLIEFVD